MFNDVEKTFIFVWLQAVAWQPKFWQVNICPQEGWWCQGGGAMDWIGNCLQVCYMTLVKVHLTMHLVDPNECHVTYILVCVCVCVCVCAYGFANVHWLCVYRPLTQISDLVVMVFPENTDTISGDRYAIVVNREISSEQLDAPISWTEATKKRMSTATWLYQAKLDTYKFNEIHCLCTCTLHMYMHMYR